MACHQLSDGFSANRADLGHRRAQGAERYAGVVQDPLQGLPVPGQGARLPIGEVGEHRAGR